MSDYGNSFGKSVRLPKLRAHYKVVRMESDAIDVEGQIVCRRCGAPLQGREGKYVLKYFLVSGR
jgi:hypothetical protein